MSRQTFLTAHYVFAIGCLRSFARARFAGYPGLRYRFRMVMGTNLKQMVTGMLSFRRGLLGKGVFRYMQSDVGTGTHRPHMYNISACMFVLQRFTNIHTHIRVFTCIRIYIHIYFICFVGIGVVQNGLMYCLLIVVWCFLGIISYQHTR